MHSKALVTSIYELYPGLRDQPAANVDYYADLVALSASPGTIPHHWVGKKGIPENAFPISSRRLREKMGQDGFLRINSLAQCLDHSDDYSEAKGVTKAYWISEQGRAAVAHAYQKAANEPSFLVDEHGRNVRAHFNAVFSKDKYNNNVVTKAKLNWAVPLNMDAIRQVVNEDVIVFFPVISANRLGMVENELRALYTAAANKNDNIGWGRIPQIYREAPSGRLVGLTNISLQNITREARDIALHGAHDYDFENCHFNILAQVAAKAGIEVPHILEYIRATRPFREWIAREADISYKQAKDCLLMMIYGAKSNPHPKCAIAQEIGIEAAEKLFQWEAFRALQTDTENVGKWMVESASRHRKTNRIINCRHKACKNTGYRSELAHLTQGIESELLHAILEFHGPGFLVIQHDGFVIQESVDPAVFEKVVEQQTGFKMRLKHEQIIVPGIL